jgi:hypothetical protein
MNVPGTKGREAAQANPLGAAELLPLVYAE